MTPFYRIAAAGLWVMAFAATARAQAIKSDSVVKITADATKPDAKGTQEIAVTLNVDKGWHVYANPIRNENYLNNQTVVTVKRSGPLKDVKIEYPAGRPWKYAGETFMIYEGKVVVKAHVQREPGDAGPLQVVVSINSCNEKSCLPSATVKLTVK